LSVYFSLEITVLVTAVGVCISDIMWLRLESSGAVRVGKLYGRVADVLAATAAPVQRWNIVSRCYERWPLIRLSSQLSVAR